MGNLKLLEEGDIIELQSGDKVYADIPCHFIYSNWKGVFDKTGNTNITIGALNHLFRRSSVR